MRGFLFGKEKKDQQGKSQKAGFSNNRQIIPDKYEKKDDDKRQETFNLNSQNTQDKNTHNSARIREPIKAKVSLKEVKSLEKEVNSMIGKNIKIKGELIGEEDIVVEGFIEGKIRLDKSLKVGESGVVIADINAKSVTVSGKIEGNIYASEKIELLPTANVQGNLFSTKIIISEGANFQGKIDMSGNNKQESVKEKSLPLSKETIKAKE